MASFPSFCFYSHWLSAGPWIPKPPNPFPKPSFLPLPLCCTATQVLPLLCLEQWNEMTSPCLHRMYNFKTPCKLTLPYLSRLFSLHSLSNAFQPLLYLCPKHTWPSLLKPLSLHEVSFLPSTKIPMASKDLLECPNYLLTNVILLFSETLCPSTYSSGGPNHSQFSEFLMYVLSL